MPSHNSAEFIEVAIKSVLAQTHRQLKLIVVDDGSRDDTVKLAKDLANGDARLQIVELVTGSGGPAKPRNIGLSRACGDYYAFIDSDDIWHPQKLELQLEAALAYGLNFVSTKHTVVTNSVTPVFRKTSRQGTIKISNITHERLLRKNIVITSSALISASFASDLIFDERDIYVGVEDYLAWLLLHQRADTRSAILKHRLVFYRLREDSISSSKLMMANKVFSLLSNYQYAGRGLGFKKLFYFSTYICGAVISRIKRLF